MKPTVKKQLPTKLYSAEAVRNLDAIAINEFNVSAYELMKRAGNAVFDYLQNNYTLVKRIVVCCGSGNNAGDGYVIARLAMKAGMDVSVISLVDPKRLTGDAKTAWQDWKALGHQLVDYREVELKKADVIVDALLGTGLQRDIGGEWAELISAINQSGKPVIAVDIPSGLYADTGRVAACAIKATATMTFIGLKKGLFTHHGVDHCGELLFDDLSIPPAVYAKQSAQAELLNWHDLQSNLICRKASTHKHQCGHVLILGGDQGMPGAVRMAAESALRGGAGLVTVVTHKEHLPVILAGRPEIMLLASDDGHVPADLLSRVNAVVVGPGLSSSRWSQNLLAAALDCHAPKVLDAGALRMLSDDTERRDDWILTPHAGEAGALLGESAADIQDSRFSSAELLQQKYSGHIILKGAGSLLQSANSLPALCPYGNPGMATAGMGDVLSGLLGGLLAQGYDLNLAAKIGLCVHSLAADRAAVEGEVGLLASDLFAHIRQLLNAQSGNGKDHA